MKRTCMVLLSVAALSATTLAEPSTQPLPQVPSDVLKGRPDETPTTRPVLGPTWSSQAAGISLRPPAGCKTITRAIGGDSIVEFVSEERKIGLRVTHASFTKPIKLSVPASTPGPVINGEKEKGLLEMTAAQFLSRMPNSAILRQDVMPLAGHDTGILVLRATAGMQPQLIQQAIIQDSEQSYFNLILTTPGQPFNAPAAQPDATELAAAKTFQAMLDTVNVLDQAKLRDDQVDRLFRTRTMFVNWTEAKMRSILIPEQWLRVIRDGKDVGYSYIVEETETRGVNPGVKIGIRSRTLPLPGKQVDAETWYHVSFDRKIENWSSIALFTGGPEKYYSTEFGSSVQRRKPVVDRDIDKDPMADQHRVKGDNVNTRLVDTYYLNVHRVTKKVTAPEIEKDLPPFYLAQGLGHLLPRLLPLKEPQGFLFYSYVSSEGEVKLRYVDVGRETEVKLGDKRVLAIPITDRLGYDAPPTTHYVNSDGHYLGSVTVVTDDEGATSTIAVLPTDRDTLTNIWKDAVLARPSEDPAPAAK